MEFSTLQISLVSFLLSSQCLLFKFQLEIVNAIDFFIQSTALRFLQSNGLAFSIELQLNAFVLHLQVVVVVIALYHELLQFGVDIFELHDLLLKLLVGGLQTGVFGLALAEQFVLALELLLDFNQLLLLNLVSSSVFTQLGDFSL